MITLILVVSSLPLLTATGADAVAHGPPPPAVVPAPAASDPVILGLTAGKAPDERTVDEAQQPHPPLPPRKPHPLWVSTSCELAQLAVDVFSHALQPHRSKVAPEWIRHPNKAVRRAVRKVKSWEGGREDVVYETSPLPVLYIGDDPCAAVVTFEDTLLMRTTGNAAFGVDPFVSDPSASVMPDCQNMTDPAAAVDDQPPSPAKVHFAHLESMQVMPSGAYSLVVVAFVLEHLALQMIGNVLVRLSFLTQSYLLVAVSRLKDDPADLITYPPGAQRRAPPALETAQWWLDLFRESGFAAATELEPALEAASARHAFARLPSGKLFLLKRHGHAELRELDGSAGKRSAATSGTALHDAEGVFSKYTLHEERIRSHDAVDLPDDFKARRRKGHGLGRQAYLEGARPAGFTVDDWQHFGQTGHAREMRLAAKVGQHHARALGTGTPEAHADDAARLGAELDAIDRLLERRRAQLQPGDRASANGGSGSTAEAQALRKDVRRLEDLQRGIRAELLHREAERLHAGDADVARHRAAKTAEHAAHAAQREEGARQHKLTEGFALWHGLKRPHWAG